MSSVNLIKAVNWLFVDLNSFFASVEQELNPALRGKPVAVIPLDPKTTPNVDTTFCLAASYPAKAYGVKTGVRVGDARKMCPGLILVHASHEAYVEYHHKIIEAIETCHPVTSVHSVDEMACRLGGRDQDLANARALALDIKSAILNRVGRSLTSSVGLAPNRYLAKVASDMQKPDGLTVILKDELPDRLLVLKLRDLPGIGPKMELRLNRRGVFTMADLLKRSRREVRDLWGSIVGEKFYDWLRGDAPHEDDTETQSLGHSHVLGPELRNPAGARRVLQKLTLKAAKRLRRSQYWASGIHVGIKFKNGQKVKAQAGVAETQDSFVLLNEATRLFDEFNLNADTEDVPFFVEVSFTGLVEDKFHTGSLFESPKNDAVTKLLDKIQNAHGSKALYLGCLHDDDKSAPTRIPFSRVPDASEF